MECAVCHTPIEQASGSYHDQPLCAACADRVDTYEARRTRRVERLRERAEKRRASGQAAVDHAHRMASVIPFGQPILIGHHSERRDRNYRNRIEKTFRRGYAEIDEAKQMDRRVEAAEKNCAISSDDPLAVLKLQEQIAAAERSQEHMKATNRIIRAGKNEHGAIIRRLVEDLGYTESQAAALLQPDFAGRIGVPDYRLRNNNANIRRMKQRLEELREQDRRRRDEPEAPGRVEVQPGLTVVRNVDENRLQIVFEGKPGAAVREVLKHHGWRWAPSQGAWQRYLNANSEYALGRTLEAIRQLEM
jgi:hypothetical protein